MKKMLILAMLYCCVAMVWAISPVKTTCQFEVRNDQGELVTSGDVNVKLSVFQGTQTGETVYVEIHSCTANAAGRVAVTLGEGGGSPSWSSLSWSDQPYYMKAEIQQGLSDFKEAGVLTLTLSEEEDANVPVNRFGSRVFLSNVALSGDYSDLTNKPYIPSSVTELSDAENYVTFDSLQRRFDEVEEELDRLRDTLNDLRAALGPIYGVPKLNEIITLTETKSSIQVDGVLEKTGSEEARVKVCAFLNEDYSDIPVCSVDTVMTEAGNYSLLVEGLLQNTTYYLLVTSDNNHKQDTLRASTSTLDVSLTINANPSDSSVSLCVGQSLIVTYTAVLVGETADTYEWTASGVEGTADGNVYTVEYSAAGTYTITCAVAGMTQSKQTVIVNAGEAIIAICEKCDVNEVVIKSGSNCTSYSWYNAEGVLVSNSSSGIKLSASIPVGVYSVVGTVSSGCSTSRVVSLGKNSVHPCTVSDGLRAGTLLPGGLYANKEFGEGNRLDSVSDHEGNIYRVVEMGGKCWLAENMRVKTSPSTGSTILLTTKYNSHSSKVACWYSHNKTSYGKYGILYNWCAAVDTFNVNAGSPEVAVANNNSTWNPSITSPRRGICPEGWHIPDDTEFREMGALFIENLKGAGRLAGGCDWYGTGTGSMPANCAYSERNISGFSALPAGCFYDGGFLDVREMTSFWSSQSTSNMYSKYCTLSHDSERFYHDYTYKYMGYSVRCMRNY